MSSTAAVCMISFRANGFVTLSLRATGDTIEHLDATQARNAARRIEQLLARRWTFEQALVEDRARIQQDWLRAFERHDWRDDVFSVSSEIWRPRSLCKSVGARAQFPSAASSPI